jgi:hypothetical protein
MVQTNVEVIKKDEREWCGEEGREPGTDVFRLRASDLRWIKNKPGHVSLQGGEEDVRRKE